VIQLWLAGLCLLPSRAGSARAGSGHRRGGELELAAWFVIQAVFPMILGASAWLPLLLLMVEFVIGRGRSWAVRPRCPGWRRARSGWPW
jgi:hypothetical protein